MDHLAICKMQDSHCNLSISANAAPPIISSALNGPSVCLWYDEMTTMLYGEYPTWMESCDMQGCQWNIIYICNLSTSVKAAPCSGKSPRYDKPSLKLRWTVKDVSATSARRRQVTPNYSVSLESSASICPLFKDQERWSQWGVEVESKRTSWIVRATILGFIYTLDVLLSKLSQSVSSK